MLCPHSLFHLERISCRIYLLPKVQVVGQLNYHAHLVGRAHLLAQNDHMVKVKVLGPAHFIGHLKAPDNGHRERAVENFNILKVYFL